MKGVLTCRALWPDLISMVPATRHKGVLTEHCDLTYISIMPATRHKGVLTEHCDLTYISIMPATRHKGVLTEHCDLTYISMMPCTRHKGVLTCRALWPDLHQHDAGHWTQGCANMQSTVTWLTSAWCRPLDTRVWTWCSETSRPSLHLKKKSKKIILQDS